MVSVVDIETDPIETDTDSDELQELDIAHSDSDDDELYHYGVKNQKWGNRRYQNHDGSLTPLGRIHYGVGEARERVGTSLRKTFNPTDDDLREKRDKAQAAYDRRRLKNEIRELRGKDKKVSDMTDQEIIDEINRHRNEAALKALRSDSKHSPLTAAVKKATTDAIARAAGNTVQSVLGNVGSNLSEAFDTEANKLKREAQMVKDRETIEKAGKKSAADKADEAQKIAKAKRDKTEAELQERALNGDEDAKRKLHNYKNAAKGNYKPEPDPIEDPSWVDVEGDTTTTYTPPPSNQNANRSSNTRYDTVTVGDEGDVYEVPDNRNNSRSRNRPYRNVEDVYDSHSDESYSSIEDAEYEEVGDIIRDNADRPRPR